MRPTCRGFCVIRRYRRSHIGHFQRLFGRPQENKRAKQQTIDGEVVQLGRANHAQEQLQGEHAYVCESGFLERFYQAGALRRPGT